MILAQGISAMARTSESDLDCDVDPIMPMKSCASLISALTDFMALVSGTNSDVAGQCWLLFLQLFPGEEMP